MIDIRQETTETITLLGFDADDIQRLFELGLITDRSAVKWLIRHEYERGILTVSKTEMRLKLAEKYCLSYDTIRTYVLESPAIL